MREISAAVPSDVEIAATLCVPEDAGSDRRAPALLLLAGTGADTRDGDLTIERASGAALPNGPAPGTMRRIAHRLALDGVATLRWDRRGFGVSAGDARTAGYHTDLADAVACYRWLQHCESVDSSRIGVAGHSAGALVASRVCRDVPGVAAAALLGALASPLDDMLRANQTLLRNHWPRLSRERQDWLAREMPASLVRLEAVDELLAAARRGDDRVVLEGRGVRLDLPTLRLRQDLDTAYDAEMRAVTCPALVLHGGDDLNVPVADAHRAYQVLREAGNRDVELVILPGLEHYFCPTPEDPDRRAWERLTRESVLPPVAPAALDVVARWAVRVLRAP